MDFLHVLIMKMRDITFLSQYNQYSNDIWDSLIYLGSYDHNLLLLQLTNSGTKITIHDKS